MSIHAEPRREHYFMTPTVTEITISRFDHNDPLFMCVHAAADDAMAEALAEDLVMNPALAEFLDERDDNGLVYGG